MKRLLMLAGAVFAIAATIATPLAASASTQDRFSVAGPGAEALFSTCAFVPGQICTDTYVAVADQVTKFGGTKFSGTTLFIDEFSYTFDRRGNFVFVSDTSGFGSASLSIDSKLTSASATATVGVVTCAADNKGNVTCAEAGTANVSVSWIGQGDLVREVANIHISTSSFSESIHFNGSFRNATASATVNGNDAGTLLFADMFNVKQADIFICHIC